jgi:hypothetical protein
VSSGRVRKRRIGEKYDRGEERKEAGGRVHV